MQAELYEMEAAMSVGVNPLWVVPYATVADDYQDLLDDFSASVEVLYRLTHRPFAWGMALLLSSKGSLPYPCCTLCTTQLPVFHGASLYRSAGPESVYV